MVCTFDQALLIVFNVPKICFIDLNFICANLIPFLFRGNLKITKFIVSYKFYADGTICYTAIHTGKHWFKIPP